MMTTLLMERAQGARDHHGAPPILLNADSQNGLALFLRAHSLYPIYQNLVSQLAPADIIILSRCCKALSSLYEDLASTDWNINKALQPFTTDPKRFRSALAKYNAVISGSFALDFFDRNVTKSSQLEIVVGVYCWDRTRPIDLVERWVQPLPDDCTRTLYRGNNCGRLFRHLVSVEGYTLSAHDQADDDAILRTGLGGNLRARWLTETMEHAELDCRIKVSYACELHSSPPEQNVPPVPRLPPQAEFNPAGARFLGHLFDRFATTAGANFILSDRAVSLFPALTFSMRRAYSMSSDYDKSAQALVRRDILPCDRFFPASLSRFEQAQLSNQRRWSSSTIWYAEERSILGPTSWVLSLNRDGISEADVPPDVFETGHYQLSVLSFKTWPTVPDGCIPSKQRIDLETTPIEAPFLRYSYCGAGSDREGVMPSSRTELIQRRIQGIWDQYHDQNLLTDAARIKPDWRTRQSKFDFASAMRGDITYTDTLKDGELPGWLKQHTEHFPAPVQDPKNPEVTITIPGITSKNFLTRT